MSVDVNDDAAEKYGSLIENLKTIGYALVIALLIRIFLFQPFNIPSGSMIPSLLVGDYLFVSKYEYGLSRHSFPFSPPLFQGRVLASPPERGDIAVFKLPSDNRTDYIKRVVGLPGDRIQMRQGALYINGQAVKRERIEDVVEVDGNGDRNRIEQYQETLANGVSYTTYNLLDRSRKDNTEVYVVPEGHYFMMGDNRDNSTDSRFSAVGYVPFENFVGKAEVIFFSTDGTAGWLKFWRWGQATRWSRIFNSL